MNPRAYVLVAIDITANVPAGFAVWLAPSTSNARHHKRHLSPLHWLLSKALSAYDTLLKTLVRLGLHWLLLYPTLGAAVIQRQKMWSSHTERLESQYISESNRKQGYWQLSLLGVHPSFGGRGIAKRLLKWGMDKADEEDRVCYLSASPKGLPVYKKAGFEVVGADLCYPHDPQGGWTETFMMRKRLRERV